MKKKTVTFLIWVVLVGAFFVLFYETDRGDRAPSNRVPIAEFVNEAENGKFDEIWVNGSEVEGEGPGVHLSAVGALSPELMRTLTEEGVRLNWQDRWSWSTTLLAILPSLLPLVLIAALFVFFIRQSKKSGAANWMALRRSTARELEGNRAVTFKDVGGCEEAKALLGDVIDYLANSGRWEKLQTRPPRGILLEGPPGCGKSLLARAVAGETKAAFFTVAASEFVELFVGVGAARVRDLFERAAKKAPAVIFIDELDAVGRRRGSGIGGSHDEREQTLNQLLVCLDGLTEPRHALVVIAATNRADILDQALLRAGRFDRRIKIPLLEDRGRAEVLRIHIGTKPLSPDVSVEQLVENTRGMTGADIECLVNEAALNALRRSGASGPGADSPTIGVEDFKGALAPLASRSRRFDFVDLAFVESASQLTEPAGPAFARIELLDGSVLEGQIVWCDAQFAKLRVADGEGGSTEKLVSKRGIKFVAALPGTGRARDEDYIPDTWAGRVVNPA